ncbi:sugar phosphate isomerase [Paenibacillus darwinianus]|uniref:Sugar phosphate isomerase n=1 Tax=Paenibacillus darwinianus TaxID=1380763 RepID=A0A9W5S2D3_9BACL|nr:sugar phosphate isomerase/epimerase [Paenibacillus darwinianus]EXX89458.1 sugar phosphate isomerase [Paenibacillus darwinianus]EXX91227.1 sugar phosphate isomerase [Paenibacillus darwinianus]EXX92489.1 sugar phosphate isomerase [Paenibacillus darwinianus]
MKWGYQTNTWGGVVGHPAGVTSVKDLYYLANGSTEEAVKDIAAAGYEGIELFDGNLMQYEERLGELRRLLDDHGLSLIGVYTGANFIYGDILEDEFAKIDKVARTAAAAGAEHLVFGGGAIRAGGIRDEDYAALAEALDRAAEVAARHGLTPSYHPHLGSLVEKPDQLDRLMKLTGIPLCPDTAHIEAGGGDPLAVIRTYSSRIPYVHFKDYGSGAFLPLGEGGQDFAAMLAALRENGYSGWVTVELDSHDNPLQGAAVSRQYINGQLANKA